MSEPFQCPVCLNRFGGACLEHNSDFDGREFRCDSCGKFRVSRTVLDDNNDFRGTFLSELERAALCHYIQRSQSDTEMPIVLSGFLTQFRKAARLPTPPELARRLLEVVGDHYLQTGGPIKILKPSQLAWIGFLDRRTANFVFEQSRRKGWIVGNESPDRFGGLPHLQSLELSLAGWEEFEALKSGLRPGHFGFLALKFDDPILDTFVQNVIKPTIKAELGYDIVDMRDVTRAGVIDNLMREQIRDSAFVLADLTHDNSGAYWEAGYAEGLGKPVIYICESSKFQEAKTHFDTNHCTTVMWSAGQQKEFREQIVPTLKRSLRMMPTSKG